MSTIIKGTAVRQLNLGLKVDRAAAALPQTATGTLFTVTGGRVLVTSITGLVATSVQNQANNTRLVATPTVGAVNDLSAVVDIANLAAGGLLAATGLAADALVRSSGGGVSGQRNPIIVAAGTIGLACAASNTGTVSWTVTYVPYDDGASLA